MENVFTWKWLRAALVRALKTVAQTAAATIGTAVMISEVDWRMVVSAALLAGALSLLTSVAGLPEAQEKSRPRAGGTNAGSRAAPHPTASPAPAAQARAAQRPTLLNACAPAPYSALRASGTSAGGRARGFRMPRRGPFGATDDPGDPCRGQPAALTRTVSHAGATPAGPSAEYQIRAMLYEHQFFSQKRISPVCASNVT